MSPNIWGPPCWNLIHTICEKIKDEHFTLIKNELFNHLIQICHNLPCPECAQHAKISLSTVNFNNIHDKNKLKNIFYVFHNEVNKRKQKKLYKYEDLEVFKNYNLIQILNKFLNTFNTNGNMKLLTDNFHRSRHLYIFKKWILQNINSFQL